MRKTAAVLGSPINHSLSPVIHNLAYRHLGLPMEYIAVEVKEAEFLEWIRAALSKSDQWFGFSLTMPLKEVVCSKSLSDLIDLDGLSRRINSANTLYLKDDKWHGCSTDVIGFRSLLQKRNFKSVAILGAGGTARAAVGALTGGSFSDIEKIEVFRRDSKRDSGISKASSGKEINILEWSEFEDSGPYDLLINTVPDSALHEAAKKYSGANLLLDAVYSPWPTQLMSRQLSDDAAYISGLELLCAQAIPQVELMCNAQLDHDEFFALALAEVSKHI